MPSVVAYHRPRSLDEASALLSEPNRRAIGGGTVVVPESRVQSDDGVEVVDLQALGLDTVSSTPTGVQLGAMVRLGDTATNPEIPAVLRELARRELPSALRNQATIGGTVALAEPESVLLAGLLAYGATINVHGDDAISLAELLDAGMGQRLITSVSFDPSGAAAWAGTARTPMDTPIVAAIAVHRQGEAPSIALTGVAPSPVLVDATNPTAGLEPPADFRGSSGYRRRLVTVLTQRALEGINQ